MANEHKQYDLIVVGAGSGGFAAAWTASRQGLHVCVIEKSDMLGGNAVRGGVNNWETGAGGTGVAFDLYQYIRTHYPNDIGIHTFGRHAIWHDPTSQSLPFPGGEHLIDPTQTYLDTLQRSGTLGLGKDTQKCRNQWHGVVYEPMTMHQAMLELLTRSDYCDLLLRTSFTTVHQTDGNISHLTLSDGSTVYGKYFLDGTADGILSQAAGCQLHLGEDPQSRYGEPSAPPQASENINGITLIFRITPTSSPCIEPISHDIPHTCWWRDTFPSGSFTQYPNGDYNVNMLPTMEGEQFMELGYQAAMIECQRRIKAYWHHIQSRYAVFAKYRINWIAPGLGVRETYRVLCEYMLTEMDLRAGLEGQSHPDIIAIADHALDTHGRHTAGGCKELAMPCGIPLRCMLPQGTQNLLIACRASGFSSIAASSCRLSRTMMQMGQAAANAVFVALKTNTTLRTLPVSHVCDLLENQHVTLAWPMSVFIVEHIKRNDPA